MGHLERPRTHGGQTGICRVSRTLRPTTPHLPGCLYRPRASADDPTADKDDDHLPRSLVHATHPEPGSPLLIHCGYLTSPKTPHICRRLPVGWDWWILRITVLLHVYRTTEAMNGDVRWLGIISRGRYSLAGTSCGLYGVIHFCTSRDTAAAYSLYR